MTKLNEIKQNLPQSEQSVLSNLVTRYKAHKEAWSKAKKSLNRMESSKPLNVTCIGSLKGLGKIKLDEFDTCIEGKAKVVKEHFCRLMDQRVELLKKEIPQRKELLETIHKEHEQMLIIGQEIKKIVLNAQIGGVNEPVDRDIEAESDEFLEIAKNIGITLNKTKVKALIGLAKLLK
jgi:hypothetical protein